MIMKQRFLALCMLSLLITGVTFAAQNDPSTAKLLETALNEFDGGNYIKAINGFSEVLIVDPANKHAWFLTAIAYQKLGKYDQELKTYNDFSKINPNDPVLYGNRAVALFRLKQYSEAFSDFKKAKSLNPKDGQYYLNNGKCLLEIGRYEEANVDLKKALSLGKNSSELTWTKRLLRQIKGTTLPPKKWIPNKTSYHTDINIKKQSNLLIDMPDKDDNKKSEGLTSLVGFPGTRIEFEGTAETPFEYAPNLYVWKGAVINDPTHGVLLENGTHFSHEVWRDGKTIRRNGRVKEWKLEYFKP